MTRQKGKPYNYEIIAMAISYLMTILWMGFIFHLSAQVAAVSNDLSTGITEVIVEAIERVVPQTELSAQDLNHFVRKYAHFFSYLVLGLLMVNSLTLSLQYARKRHIRHWIALWPHWRIWLVAFGFCVLYAVSDEIHQLFVPGRGCQVSDMLIDSSGSALGIGIYAVLFTIIMRKRNLC